jgi:hypothetical protein
MGSLSLGRRTRLWQFLERNWSMIKEQLLATAVAHAKAEIQLHKTNVDVYLQGVVGIGEHSDIMETIQLELDKMATAHDRLEMLNVYFEVAEGLRFESR